MIKNGNDIFDLQAEICQSLADPKRLMIVAALRDGEQSVGELAIGLGLRQSNMSQHLAVLRAKGLVNTRREGATVYYSLRSPKISQACDLVHRFLMENLETNVSLVAMGNTQPSSIPANYRLSHKEQGNARLRV